MNDDRFDLEPLRLDRERAEHAARAVLARARGTLAARRRMQGSLWGELGAWERPLLASASLVALLSIGMLVRVRALTRSSDAATLSEQAGVPLPIAAWAESDQPPQMASLLGL